MTHDYNKNTGEPPLHEFFAGLYAGVPYDCVTTINGFNGTGKAAFTASYTVDSIDEMVACVDAHRNDPKVNIYYRMAPLKERPAPGKRGGEDETAGSIWLWCDLDTYNTQKSTTEAIDALEQFAQPPSFIIHTGRGVQAGWKLREFCTDLHLIKCVNKWIEQEFKAYGADSVADYARVLRVPTTINHKPNSLGAAHIVMWRMDRVYQIGDFGWSPVEPAVYGEPLEPEALPRDFLQEIRTQGKHGELLYTRMLSEETAKESGAQLTDSGGKVDRSRNDWFIAKTLLSFGYTKELIMAVLTHETWFSGSRFRQQRNYDYVNRTIQAAAFNLGGDSSQYFERVGESKTARFIPQLMYGAIVRGGTKFLRLTGEGGVWLDGIYYYDKGFYKRTGVQYIQEEIEQRLGKVWSPRYAEDTIKFCRANRAIPEYSIYKKPVRKTLAECEVNTLSGWVNVKTGDIRAHSPDTISFYQLPVRYMPEWKGTVVDTYIRQVLPPDTVNTFWEYVGYCLLLDYRYKKALFLLGERDSSKSTVCDLLRSFLGHHNATSITLQDITESKFDKAALLNKLANIYPDLSATEVKGSGVLKAITGGDSIKGERKYEHAFDFYPTAKHIYSANAYVPTADPDVDAYVERWLIIPLQHVFRDDAAPADDIQKANKRLIDDLTTPENLSEMLNLALSGLRRLLLQDKFTKSATIDKAVDDYRSFLDSVYGHLIARTEEAAPGDPDGYVVRNVLLHDYNIWCGGDTNRRAVGEPKFYARMKYLIKKMGMREGTKTIDGVERYVYRGRKLKQNSSTAGSTPGFLIKKTL